MQHRPTDTDTLALKWHPNLWQGQPVNDGFHDSVEHRGTPRNGLRGRAGKGRISVACVKKKGGRMSEMCRSPEWQTQTWSQLWQRPNPPNPLSLCWKTLMRIWSAQRGGAQGQRVHLATACSRAHCLLISLLAKPDWWWKSRDSMVGLRTQTPRLPGSTGSQTPRSDPKSRDGISSRCRDKTNWRCLSKIDRAKSPTICHCLCCRNNPRRRRTCLFISGGLSGCNPPQWFSRVLHKSLTCGSGAGWCPPWWQAVALFHLLTENLALSLVYVKSTFKNTTLDSIPAGSPTGGFIKINPQRGKRSFWTNDKWKLN